MRSVKPKKILRAYAVAVNRLEWWLMYLLRNRSETGAC